ncbi:MAG: KpsF/GutQ family sugar-phosphate isomerase [Chitinophagales bacterium]|nr:KpsF/GutQ family sugar-phosphate isomerase [Chitinophagales bacterium]
MPTALTDDDICAIARQTLHTEAAAIADLVAHIDDDFVATVRAIAQLEGRLVVTGIGKSAIIAQKIVATFNSTGTPALFMHAADAVHGDLGMVQATDMVLCLSNSGETPEITYLISLLSAMPNTLVAITGNANSHLARQARYTLLASVAQECCPHNLAPTSSTTAQLALGDALAVAVLSLRGFTPDDFARYHPGGALGKKLYLRVRDLCAANARPQVSPHDDWRKVVFSISSCRLGATVVISPHNQAIEGIITDGDLRRGLSANLPLDDITAQSLMTHRPKTVTEHELAVTALQLMRQHKITQLVVLNEQGQYGGMVHLHDILREGII